MKNIFRFLMAVAVLFTASCAKEDISSSIGGGEVEVTFTANLPELGTRAYGEAGHITTLHYFVYDQNGTLLDFDGDGNSTTTIKANQPAKVNLPLIKGMTYKLAFWADNGSYNIANNVVSVNYGAANNDSLDAFYALIEEFDPAKAEDQHKTSVTLNRPFAQLNALTDDFAAVALSGVNIETSTVKVVAYTQFNVANGDVVEGAFEEIEFDATAIPTETLAGKEDYKYLSMNYILVPKAGHVSNVEFTFTGSKNVTIKDTKYDNVPFKQNYRTNIIGKLLTASTDFKVTIDPVFDTPDKDIVQTAAELQQQIENAQPGEPTEIVLGSDINLNDLLASLGTLSTRAAATPSLTIPAGKNITLNLNGCTLSATENSTGSYALITNQGTLTISDSKGDGMMLLTATKERNWNAYSSVISNQPGGVLTVDGGTIEHLGGTAMAYGIDNLTNGKGTSAVATINGGTVKSTYRAVRQFLNGVEANNSLTINGGTIEGANKSIWMQDPSANANTGTLVISEDASLIGDVYLFVTAGSTEWPVNVTIADAALKNGATVLSGNVPAGYEVAEENGVWTVNFVPVAKIGDKGYGTLDAAVAAVQDGETITFVADIEQVDGVIITDKNLTIDLNGKTFTVSEGANTNNRNFKIKGSSVVTIKNGTMVAAGEYSSGAYGTLRTEGTANVTLEGVKLYNYRGNGLNVKALSGTTVTINDTEIYSQYGGGVEAAGGNVVLNNVTIDQKGMYTAPYNSMAISVNGGGVATVNSGTYSTVCITTEEANNQGTSHGPWCAGVLNSGGKLIINGGTFSNDNFGENALATAARGILLADTGANIQINGGIFNALKAIVDVTNNLGDATRNPSVTLAGGDFSADPRISGLYASHLISVAEGYKVTEENGRWILNFIPAAKIGETTYNTLQDAIKAVQEGATMELNRDITLAETLVIPADKNFTLDLKGKTVTAPASSAFEAKANGELTIKNGKVVAYESVIRAIGGKVTIESGEFTQTGTALDSPATYRYAIDSREGGKITINGGTFKSNNGMINVSSEVIINGGKFENIVEKSMTRHFAYVSALITINDGEFYGKANGGAGGCFFCGAAAGGDIQINGGKFTSLWTSGSVNRIFEYYYGGTINVTGGLFNTNGGIATFVTENTDAATKAAYPYVAK